jgi:hypothetical protein
MEFRDDKVARETQYFADPFPAPASRAQWVERNDRVNQDLNAFLLIKWSGGISYGQPFFGGIAAYSRTSS